MKLLQLIIHKINKEKKHLLFMVAPSFRYIKKTKLYLMIDDFCKAIIYINEEGTFFMIFSYYLEFEEFNFHLVN